MRRLANAIPGFWSPNVPLGDPKKFDATWYRPEQEGRQCWTRGAARLPPRPRLVVISQVGIGQGLYWRPQHQDAVAAPDQDKIAV